MFTNDSTGFGIKPGRTGSPPFLNVFRPAVIILGAKFRSKHSFDFVLEFFR